MDPYRRLLEEELRWYFSEAPGHCGLRSSLGPQLELLEHGIVLEHGYPSSDAAMAVGLDRRLEEDGWQGSRLRGVAQKLACLPVEDARVLELAYAQETRVNRTMPCSLALACATPTARYAYTRAIESSRRRAASGKASAKSKAQAVAVMTIREWMQWLALTSRGQPGKPRAEMLKQILWEAEIALNGAMHAYALASQKEAA